MVLHLRHIGNISVIYWQYIGTGYLFEIYRQYIGTDCTRSALARQINFLRLRVRTINQAQLRASEEKDSKLAQLEPILAQVQQSADQVNHVEWYDIFERIDLIYTLQLLWEPFLKLNISTMSIPFPDNVIDFPKVLHFRNSCKTCYLWICQ